MKKIFKLTDEKKHEDRVLEAIKHDIRKYVNREKKKKLSAPETTYWDFDCKVGPSSEDANDVKYEEMMKALDGVKASGVKEVYVEIIAKTVNKPVKVQSDDKAE